jgi:glycosyltransferase involved in cell wall biosynthesis
MRRGLRNKAKDSAGRPLVSIIVASYNYEKYIGQTIQSVLSQTYPNWELIISDDCSTDNSVEIIRSFSDDRITLLTTDTNTGGRHVAEAYAISKGEYLCSLDSDDFIAPDKIEKQLRFLEHHPEVDVLGTFVVEVDAEGDATEDRNGHEAWFNRDIDLNQPESWAWQNHLAHSSVLMRKSLYDRIGPLNHDLFITADYEFWARCVVQKVVFQVLPEKLTYYRYHGGNVTHKDPERLFLECAYIFYSILSPHLIEIGRADLVIDTILDLPARNLGVELGQTFRSHLLSGLLRNHRTTDFRQVLETLKEHPKKEESLASAIVDKFVSTSKKQNEWVREVEQAKSWLEQQRAKWQTEAERGAQLLKDQYEQILELEQTKSGLEQQRAHWQSEAERGAQLLKDQYEQILELEQTKSGLEQQRAHWQSEAERGAQLLEQQSEQILELEQCKSGLEQQRAHWQSEAERGEQLLKRQSEQIIELKQSKSGLEQQRAHWQSEAERGAQLLKDQDEQILELKQTKSRVEQERAHWQSEAERGAQLLQKRSERIRDLDQSKSSLERQLANKTKAMEELQKSATMLAEVEDYFRSQIEIKDRLIADQNGIIEAKSIELASRDEELIRFKYSKLQRLKHSIRHDDFSFRKLARITYLLTALATPKFIRQRLKPLEQKGKEFFTATPQDASSSVQPEPDAPVKPLVSIIIPCFNYGKYVEDAIDSVLAQTFQRFEIIVVDGGSTDAATISTLRSLRKPKTKIYFRKGRHLVGDNRNFGISKAQGKYICCLDADDKLKPTYLEKALFLLETRHYDVISTSLEVFGEKEDVWYVPKTPSLDDIVKWNQFTTVAVFRKEFWEKAGGYHDTGLGKDYIYEDWDFWVRIMALGARATNIAAEPLMLYRSVQDSSLSKNPEMKSMDEQAQAIVAHNQEHLQPTNFQESRARNNLQFDVSGDYTNLLDEQRAPKDRTRVLFALPFVITGGADTVLLQIAKHLVENGFDISVLTTLKTDASFGDNTPRYQEITDEIYHLYNFLEDEAVWKEFILYLIEAKAIDIIFIVGCAVVYDILPEIKQRFPHVKIVDQLFNEVGHIQNNRKHASLIDFNVLANESVKEVLIEQYGEAAEKTRVIVHGVDVEEEFNPENIDTSDVWATGQVPRDKLIISFIGRFSEEKRPEMFVDIANALKGLDQLHFVMIGHGPDYNRVKQQISELDMEDRIYAPGIVEDIKPFLKLTDVLVIPSRIEGIPIVLMEALALGVPVVASDVGGIPSILTDNETGFVCDRGRIEDFIQCVERLCVDASLRAKLKHNARAYASEYLSIHKMTTEYHEVFQHLSPQNLERRQQKNPLRKLIPFKFNQFVRQARTVKRTEM